MIQKSCHLEFTQKINFKTKPIQETTTVAPPIIGKRSANENLIRRKRQDVLPSPPSPPSNADISASFAKINVHLEGLEYTSIEESPAITIDSLIGIIGTFYT